MACARRTPSPAPEGDLPVPASVPAPTDRTKFRARRRVSAVCWGNSDDVDVVRDLLAGGCSLPRPACLAGQAARERQPHRMLPSAFSLWARPKNADYNTSLESCDCPQFLERFFRYNFTYYESVLYPCQKLRSYHSKITG